MAVKIVEKETTKRKVDFLVDTDVEFISLVRHGANRTPFRIVKSEVKGGVEKKMVVVQSILLPTGKKVEDLTQKEELAWLSEAKVDAPENFEEYVRHTQLEIEKFDQATLQLTKLDDSGAYALIGALKEGSTDENVLTLGKAEVEKLALVTPLDEVVERPAVMGVVNTFRDVFERELSSMLDVVYGSLKQSAQDPKKRKKMVLDSIDAFRMFLAMSLDNIGKSEVEMGEPSELLIKPKGGMKKMFKSMEEFTEATTEVITGVLKKLELIKDPEDETTEKDDTETTEKDETQDAPTGETQDEPDIGKSLTEIRTLVTDLGAQVKVIAEKQENLESQPATDRTATEIEDQVIKDEEDKNKSPFAGLLVVQK